jgi:hypothetical protein
MNYHEIDNVGFGHLYRNHVRHGSRRSIYPSQRACDVVLIQRRVVTPDSVRPYPRCRRRGVQR